MIERAFWFRDCGRVVRTTRAPHGVAVANGSMRIARGTPDREHARIARDVSMRICSRFVRYYFPMKHLHPGSVTLRLASFAALNDY